MTGQTGADAMVVAPENLMQMVGARVRAARQQRGMPRRVLSEKSGVSPRYLSQLEAGEGNISISLLERVATALGQPIEWFVGAAGPVTPDVASLNALFAAADPDTRQRALDLLAGANSDTKAQRICLIGLRGAGKSTLGRAAAAQLDVPFVEFNAIVEDLAGMPVSEIMALYGAEGYRKFEADALNTIVATYPRVIVAAAGGVVAEPATFTRLLSNCHAIWVKATAQDHMDRVRAQGDTRPMSGNPEAMAQLRNILSSREPLYARADSTIDTAGQDVDASLDQLLALIKKRDYLSSAT